MKEQTLSIHSENILPIIKKWLYSDHDIFLRELISNATDAIHKLEILGKGSETPKIDITLDKEKKTLTIADTGIGMTAEEVEKYIAQIAFSGAEEFVEKYRDQTEKDSMIGHFGLGFYSAYMVASKVEIQTLSYLEGSKPVFWSCDGSSSYLIGEGNREHVGTSIILHLNEDTYAEEMKIKELLNRYCIFMPYAISLNGTDLNNKAPLWMKSPADCEEKEYLEFHRQLFPMDPDPLFWVHLNVDYPFHLKGILYFPKMQRKLDPQEPTIKLFCNRVFVSDNCKDILPDYLMVLKGAIDSPDIPLNVSRSYLQVDQNVRSLSSHISKKVSDKLATFYRTDRDKFIEVWEHVEMLIKLGILQDDKFYERVKDLLIWKNGQDQWTTLTEYLERAPEKKVYYAASDRKTPLLKLYQEKGLEVLFAGSAIDTAVIQALEGKLSLTFQRIDGALQDTLLDPSKEQSVLDAEGKTQSARMASLIQKTLDREELEVEAKSLASETLPALLIVDESQRRLRDYMRLTGNTGAEAFQPKKTFVVNTNHPLLSTIEKLQEKRPEIAKDLIQSLYDLSLLSQREAAAEEVDQVIEHQTKTLETLGKHLLES